jgi:pyruvate decarboxylase
LIIHTTLNSNDSEYPSLYGHQLVTYNFVLLRYPTTIEKSCDQSEMSSSTVAKYLFHRLHQLGIRALHGVPGDYNLTALDYVEKCGLKWVGNPNELNAGQSILSSSSLWKESNKPQTGSAADVYARIKGIGAVLTTFGVGELSLTNDIAGSRADNVPVVHIVGTPSTKSQIAGSILHHTFGNGNFKVFKEISERLTVAQANLWDPENAPAEIDRVLRECWIQSRPVYIQLPTDMVNKPVDRTALDAAIDLSYPTNDKELEASTAEAILKRLYEAQNPVLLIDGCVRRNRVSNRTKFVKKNVWLIFNS